MAPVWEAKLKERIVQGIRRLDERARGWHAAIDLDSLDMGNGMRCVLAQLAGSWEAGKSHYVGSEDPATFAFSEDRDMPDLHKRNAELTAFWQFAIRQLRLGIAPERFKWPESRIA